MPEQRRGFLKTATGHLAVVEIRPEGRARGSIVFVPAFAEEMNRCRRVAAVLGRRLAASGWHWVMPDLRGTGESSGCLHTLTAQDWIDDLAAVLSALDAEDHPIAGLVGVRLGALLAAAAASRLPESANLVLWQPLVNGGDQVRELIAQRALSDRLRGDADAASSAELRADLANGVDLELGGYRVSRALAESLETLDLSVLDRGLPARCHWLEIARRRGETDADVPEGVQVQRVNAAPFWLQPEAPFPDEVVDATAAVFSA